MLTNYDFTKATSLMVKKVKAIIRENELNPAFVATKAEAAGSVMRWVEDWLDAAEASGQINNLQAEMKDINMAIEELNAEHEEDKQNK